MASFVPCSQYFRESYIDGIWYKDRFDNFVDDFNIKSAMHISSGFISNSSVYLDRFLASVGRKPPVRYEERYSFGRKNNLDDYIFIFDHPTAFKMENGCFLIVSMPYGRKEDIIDAFREMQEKHPPTRTIDLYFLDQKYKYRKNGDEMILLSSWIVGKHIKQLEDKQNYHWR